MNTTLTRKAEQRAAFYRDGRATVTIPGSRASTRPTTRPTRPTTTGSTR